jgi:DNA gyrase/topoisomerase IV subunit A
MRADIGVRNCLHCTVCTATQCVLQKYGLSQEQADAILALRLGRLTAAEETKLKKEHEELSEQVLFVSVTV